MFLCTEKSFPSSAINACLSKSSFFVEKRYRLYCNHQSCAGLMSPVQSSGPAMDRVAWAALFAIFGWLKTDVIQSHTSSLAVQFGALFVCLKNSATFAAQFFKAGWSRLLHIQFLQCNNHSRFTIHNPCFHLLTSHFVESCQLEKVNRFFRTKNTNDKQRGFEQNSRLENQVSYFFFRQRIAAPFLLILRFKLLI